jgi:hypothetical protein
VGIEEFLIDQPRDDQEGVLEMVAGYLSRRRALTCEKR